MKFEVLDDCPEWALIGCFGSGNSNWQKMLSAVAETFAPEEDEPATHLHFYCSREEARELWEEMKNGVPETIKTVSFSR